jgi:hypothetical protein
VLVRRFPRALLATLAVVGLPLLIVSALGASGAVTGFIPLVLIGMALSVAASYIGTWVWARIHSGDVTFSELMLWGWVKRWRLERQLASAIRLLGLEERAVMGESTADGELGPGADLSAARHVQVLKQLAAALEGRYPDTHGHSRRVARHATVISKRMGLPAEEVARIRTAATLHDVGKVDLSPSIINKPAKLNDAEDKELTRIVRHHHERLDGRGYPAGLEGKEIPLGARIIAVADTFDALTSTRPYRSARRHKEALNLLADEAGTQLDPAAVRAFRSSYAGYRVVALWALALNAPRQLLASLAGEAKLGGVSAAATLATVAAGTVAVHSFHADHSVPLSPPKAQSASATSTEMVPLRLLGMIGLNGVGDRRAASSEEFASISRGAIGRGHEQDGLSSQPEADGTLIASTEDGSSTPAPSASGDSTGQSTDAGNSPVRSVAADSTSATDSSEKGSSRGNEKRSENSNAGGNGNGHSSESNAGGNSNGNGHSSESNAGGNGNGNGHSEGSNAGGNGHGGESVTLPPQASEKAKEAVEGVVKGGGHSAPVSVPAPPTPPVEPPKGPPPGKGKSTLVP